MRNGPGATRSLEVGVVVLAVLASGAILFWRHRTPLSTARNTTSQVAAALAAKDLKGLESSATPTFFHAFLESLSRPAFERARHVFADVIPDLAARDWRFYRRRAYDLAAAEYQQLRTRIDEEGRLRFGELAVEERMRLIQSNGFESFVAKAGLAALPEDQQRAIGDPGSLGTRSGLEAFAEWRGWALLPQPDRELLGAAEALSIEDTPAKLAFFDRVAAPLLTDEDREAILGIPRASVESPSTFAQAHGVAVVKGILDSTSVTGGDLPVVCRYPEADAGSALWTSSAHCELTLTIEGQPVPLRLDLVKSGTAWRAQGGSEELLAALGR